MEGENKVEQLIRNIKEYAETRFDIALLDIQDKISEILSSIASIAIVAIISIFIIFFTSVGAAWWIGQVLHNPSIGFFCVAGFYLLVAIIIIVNRDKWIKLPIINGLLKKININEED
ncbi:MAG TPA: phage holin family protein [Bacteroidia bacterium]|nr:phage holin family protein [Bacteroidia bacterium]